MNLPILGTSCKWNHTIFVLLYLGYLRSITFPWSIYVAIRVIVSLLFMDEKYSIICTCHILFFHSSVIGGYLNCFYFSATMNNAIIKFFFFSESMEIFNLQNRSNRSCCVFIEI